MNWIVHKNMIDSDEEENQQLEWRIWNGEPFNYLVYVFFLFWYVRYMEFLLFWTINHELSFYIYIYIFNLLNDIWILFIKLLIYDIKFILIKLIEYLLLHYNNLSMNSYGYCNCWNYSTCHCNGYRYNSLFRITIA